MSDNEIYDLHNLHKQDILGTGAYSTVYKSSSKTTGKKYALKCIIKSHLVKNNKVKYAMIERNAMQRLQRCRDKTRPYHCVELFATLQDKDSLYFVMNFQPNGDLLQLIHEKPQIASRENVIAYVSSQMIDTVRFIQTYGVIHRDIKPENFLFNDEWTLKLTDFGSAKLLSENDDLDCECKSFVGTAEYVTPELLTQNHSNHRCDYWSLICIIYQLKFNKPPFKGKSEYLTFQLIQNPNEEVSFPSGIDISQSLHNLIKYGLIKDWLHRLSPESLIQHVFFKNHNIDLNNIDQIWTPQPHIFD